MKIYKITEASEYIGVSINTLKTLANYIKNGDEYIQLKLTREKHNPKEDNRIDIAGYATVLDELQKGGE